MTATASTPTVAGAASAPAAPSTDSPAPAAPSTDSPAPAAPSVHVRALITWLAIFPLVALGMLLIAPISAPWHPVLRALVLTVVVVPLAVYLVVPKLFAGYGALRRRAARRRVSPRD